MTLQQLKYVIKIVEYRSITETARNIYISQPALSNSVKELEKELGIEIFSRNTKGIVLTSDGAEFLSYARQVVEQADLLEERYTHKKPSRQRCSISTQHYAFAVNAFCNIIRDTASDEYEYTLRETRTSEIIEDVRNMKSELGILYLNDFNRKVLAKLLHENLLVFHPLFKASPHVFVSASCELSHRKSVTFGDLDAYPYLSFEQGDFNSFYFSEEMQSTVFHRKNIHVSDRGTLFNLIIGVNGYTISSGVVTSDLNGTQIVAVPLAVDDSMTIGYITNSRTTLSRCAQHYIDELRQIIGDYGCSLLS